MKWIDIKAELEKQGLKDDDEVGYIDCYYGESLHVSRHDDHINIT